MVERVVPTIASDRYNALGAYVLRERGDLTLTQIAKRGNLEPNRLGRWCRIKLDRLPPLDVLQGIADGLGRPLVTVQAVALRASTGQPAVTTLDDDIQAAAAALITMTPEMRRMAIDQVLRAAEADHAYQERLAQSADS